MSGEADPGNTMLKMRERLLQVCLVDPSLFTGPYDAALTFGLLSHDIQPIWATRPTRAGDRPEIDPVHVDDFFYRGVDENEALSGPWRKAIKGLAHVQGLFKLVWRVWKNKPDVVHFQWAVLPLVDVVFMRLIQRWCPVVLTVHDTIPFNGERLSFWQNVGFDAPLKVADRLIVHTQAGRQALVQRGVDPDKVTVVRHGPLALADPMPPQAQSRFHLADGRWTFVLFGEIKPYKGLDVLIEALALLPVPVRQQARVVVAGRARMDIDPLVRRVEALGLNEVVEWHVKRLSDGEMAHLFAAADCLLFPYRQIDASGVYYLTKSLGKWLIASRVGIFKEDLLEGEGTLVPPEQPAALAEALLHALQNRPVPVTQAVGQAWVQIGQETRQVYAQALVEGRYRSREAGP